MGVNGCMLQNDVEMPIPKYFVLERMKALKEREKLLGQILSRLGAQDRDTVRQCVTSRGVVLKKEVGRTPETRLTQRFLNNLGLHTLIHVRKIATADLWSCPAIQLLVFECL